MVNAVSTSLMGHFDGLKKIYQHEDEELITLLLDFEREDQSLCSGAYFGASVYGIIKFVNDEYQVKLPQEIENAFIVRVSKKDSGKCAIQSSQQLIRIVGELISSKDYPKITVPVIPFKP